MGCWKVVQSNPASYVGIYYIYMWYNPLGGGAHINTCILGLETYLGENTGSPFYPFFG